MAAARSTTATTEASILIAHLPVLLFFAVADAVALAFGAAVVAAAAAAASAVSAAWAASDDIFSAAAEHLKTRTSTSIYITHVVIRSSLYALYWW